MSTVCRFVWSVKNAGFEKLQQWLAGWLAGWLTFRAQETTVTKNMVLNSEFNLRRLKCYVRITHSRKTDIQLPMLRIYKYIILSVSCIVSKLFITSHGCVKYGDNSEGICFKGREVTTNEEKENEQTLGKPWDKTVYEFPFFHKTRRNIKRSLSVLSRLWYPNQYCNKRTPKVFFVFFFIKK